MPEPVIVTLSWEWLERAAIVGVRRQVNNLRHGRNHRWKGDRKLAWQYHTDGATGECAVAKHFKVPWNGEVGNLKVKDVGPLQVRTAGDPKYRLIVHPEDLDDDPFILVIADPPRFTIHGWVMGRDAKQDRYWTDPHTGRPAYFVPQADLLDIRTLELER